MDKKDEVIVGSGNVYADLGYADPELARVKADLIRNILAIISERGWTQAQAAEQLGVDQPTVSHLARGLINRFSVERLMSYLTRLGNDVDISTAPKEPTRAVARVAVLDHYGHREPMAAASPKPKKSTGVRFD